MDRKRDKIMSENAYGNEFNGSNGTDDTLVKILVKPDVKAMRNICNELKKVQDSILANKTKRDGESAMMKTNKKRESN